MTDKIEKRVIYDMLRTAERRANRLALPFNITAQDITIPKTCPVLGLNLYKGSKVSGDNSPTLDRILPTLGYVRGNVMVISGRANRIKSDANWWELQTVANFYNKYIRGTFQLGNNNGKKSR
jgi:hypothetical protein